jgi:hypothetical protein
MPRIFPPKATEIPKGYWRNGYGQSVVRSCWGEVKVRTQRLKRKDGKQTHIFCDGSLDNSGWSPEALERLLDLVIELPYETASTLAQRFGLAISSSGLERLLQPYLVTCQTQLQTTLTQCEPSKKDTSKPASKRLMVLQTDGVFVLKRPELGSCEGMEIKSAVLYPQTSPQDRVMLADGCEAQSFLPLLSGLTKHYCSHNDFIVGVGDGAPWVEEALDLLANLRITDVFHSCQYLDVLMQELGWDESKRTLHRRAWCQGGISAQQWLSLYLPSPHLRNAWSQPALTALDYLLTGLTTWTILLSKLRVIPSARGKLKL